MEIASAEVNGCSDRMMYPGAREESILVSEDSSYTNPLGAKSRKFNGFSGAKHEEESKSNLTVPLPKVSDHAVQQVVSGTAEANLNHSDESARTPNTGTFHWRDYDTDSDLENAKMSEWGSNDGRSEKDGDTASSEDGWTYVAATQDEEFEPGDQIGNGDNSANKVSSREMKYFSAKSIPKSGSISTLSNREPISSIDTRLVDRADEMFRYHHKSYTGKQTTMKLPAKEGSEEKPLDSCDASGEYTEDSDERESHSSEDNEGSIATCKRSGSADGILDDTPIAKGLNESFLRNQRSTIRNRPWSMSNVSQLRNMRGSTLKTRSSRSESALNQMLGQLDKSLKNNRVPSMEDGTWGSCGSARKRRTKIRKRLFKRSNSGSDGVTQSGACTETDEESIGVGTPAFCLGPTAGIVTIAPGEREIQAYWDDYQEKYPSEAYSEEPADSETAKELLEFGEDYGKYLGNKSDCSSKWSRPPRKNRHNRQRIDSTSDFNEVKRFLRQSKDQLGLVEMKLKESSNGYSCATELNGQELIPNSFLDEIIETCKRNVNSLTTLLNEVNDEMHVQREKNYIQKRVYVEKLRAFR
ncbi:hypothetical protein RUM43_010367 [Polyplax serrata]|uniref:Uncharacterized protein n=1 Tax=Polyplax serrata TaxID=468196 RepID=A0AAN8PLA6_POLSC